MNVEFLVDKGDERKRERDKEREVTNQPGRKGKKKRKIDR